MFIFCLFCNSAAIYEIVLSHIVNFHFSAEKNAFFCSFNTLFVSIIIPTKKNWATLCRKTHFSNNYHAKKEICFNFVEFNTNTEFCTFDD